MALIKSKSFVFGVAAAALLCCASAQANLVINGGFEADPTDFLGWNESPGTYSGVDASAAHDGLYGAFFGTTPGTSTISQTLATEAGKTYSVSFWLQNEKDPNGDTAPNSFTFDWGGANVLSLTDASDFLFQHYEFFVVASSASTDISFSFSQTPAFWDFDSVDAHVPEPGSFALAGLAGVLAFGVSNRRRRTTSLPSAISAA
jgi:hypothetical protein